MTCEVCGRALTRRQRRFCSLSCSASRPGQGRAMLPMESAAARLAARVRQQGACLIWNGPVNRAGYGKMWFQGTTTGAHRVAWMVANGRAIPEGLSILHSCDNPRCCRPSHLSPGTVADNQADRTAKRRNALSARYGSDHPAAILTDEQVAAIRTRYASGGISQRGLARLYPVSYQTIGRIIRRERWAHN